MRWINAIFLAVLGCLPAAVGASDDQYVREYIERLKANSMPVFYVSCGLPKGKTGLLFPLGERQGLFFEMTDGLVVNSADVTLKDGKWAVDEALGGVYTIRRVAGLVDSLLQGSFMLMTPEDVSRILTTKPRNVCREKNR